MWKLLGQASGLVWSSLQSNHEKNILPFTWIHLAAWLDNLHCLCEAAEYHPHPHRRSRVEQHRVVDDPFPPRYQL